MRTGEDLSGTPGRAMVAGLPMSPATPTKPDPHPGTAALAIALMALAVAGVVQLTGLGAGIDGWLLGRLAGLGLDGDFRALPVAAVWGWTTLLVLGLTQALLHVVGHWRRWLLSALALGLTLGWVPVLVLAAYEAPVAVPLLALLWAVGGSMIYAVRHREPV